MSGKWRSRYAAQSSDDDDNEQTNVNGETTATTTAGKFTTADVIAANQQLLNAISQCDYQTYNELCADDLTAFEPESNGMLICGKSFHKFYFDLYGGGSSSDNNIGADRDNAAATTTTTNKEAATQSSNKINITMSNPHVRWLGGGCCSDGCGDGSAAVISYVRMDQSVDWNASSDEDKGGPVTKLCSETRVWENRDGRLVHVHFHKS
jgi:hypothetical protein